MPWQSKSYQGLWLTDFDGTIKPGNGDDVAAADKEALRCLGAAGWFRAVVTGRSLFGFVKAWEADLELDALIFSSGVGLCAWSGMGPGRLLSGRVFEPRESEMAIRAAFELGYGFYAYQAPPDNHHFYYQRPKSAPLGFERRLEIFEAQARPWPHENFDFQSRPLCQVMLMVPAEAADAAEDRFRLLAPGLSLIRSSSPFGDGCLWLEIYPPNISKSRASALLAERLGLTAAQSVALGNDYNDDDMLAWAGRSFVTEDAPPHLTARYSNIAPAGRGGLAWAVKEILSL